MSGREWERESVARYREAVMSVLADGGWRRGDEIHAAVLPAVHDRHESLSVSLCLDVLAIARREIDMRKVERDGMLIDFEFRLHRDEPVRKAYTLEDFA
jgi:hypothetical protein